MKKLITLLALAALALPLAANADPQRVQPINPSLKKVDESPDPPGKVTIKYGIWGTSLTSRQMNQADYYQCANLMFPGDPAPGAKKACYLANGTKIADEGGFFTTPGPACARTPVKYVALNGATRQRNLCPGREVQCSNATFGDPFVGVVKHCEINGQNVAAENHDFSVPPPPVPGGNCLCDGVSVTELRVKYGQVLNAQNHD